MACTGMTGIRGRRRGPGRSSACGGEAFAAPGPSPPGSPGRQGRTFASGRFDEPEHACARPCSCRCRSRPPGPASRPGDIKIEAHAVGPPSRRRPCDRRRARCGRGSTSSIPGLRGAAFPFAFRRQGSALLRAIGIHLCLVATSSTVLRVPARPCPSSKRGHGASRHPFVGERAAGLEGTSRADPGEVRWPTRDRH